MNSKYYRLLFLFTFIFLISSSFYVFSQDDFSILMYSDEYTNYLTLETNFNASCNISFVSLSNGVVTKLLYNITLDENLETIQKSISLNDIIDGEKNITISCENYVTHEFIKTIDLNNIVIDKQNPIIVVNNPQNNTYLFEDISTIEYEINEVIKELTFYEKIDDYFFPITIKTDKDSGTLPFTFNEENTGEIYANITDLAGNTVFLNLVSLYRTKPTYTISINKNQFFFNELISVSVSSNRQITYFVNVTYKNTNELFAKTSSYKNKHDIFSFKAPYKETTLEVEITIKHENFIETTTRDIQILNSSNYICDLRFPDDIYTHVQFEITVDSDYNYSIYYEDTYYNKTKFTISDTSEKEFKLVCFVGDSNITKEYNIEAENKNFDTRIIVYDEFNYPITDYFLLINNTKIFVTQEIHTISLKYGQYSLEISKNDYQTLKNTFFVTDENIYKFTLKKKKELFPEIFVTKITQKTDTIYDYTLNIKNADYCQIYDKKTKKILKRIDNPKEFEILTIACGNEYEVLCEFNSINEIQTIKNNQCDFNALPQVLLSQKEDILSSSTILTQSNTSLIINKTLEQIYSNLNKKYTLILGTYNKAKKDSINNNNYQTQMIEEITKQYDQALKSTKETLNKFEELFNKTPEKKNETLQNINKELFENFINYYNKLDKIPKKIYLVDGNLIILNESKINNTYGIEKNKYYLLAYQLKIRNQKNEEEIYTYFELKPKDEKNTSTNKKLIQIDKKTISQASLIFALTPIEIIENDPLILAQPINNTIAFYTKGQIDNLLFQIQSQKTHEQKNILPFIIILLLLLIIYIVIQLKKIPNKLKTPYSLITKKSSTKTSDKNSQNKTNLENNNDENNQIISQTLKSKKNITHQKEQITEKEIESIVTILSRKTISELTPTDYELISRLSEQRIENKNLIKYLSEFENLYAVKNYQQITDIYNLIKQEELLSDRRETNYEKNLKRLIESLQKKIRIIQLHSH